MKQTNYLYLLLGFCALILTISVSMYKSVNFSIKHTNVKTNFLYEGSTEKTTVQSYYVNNDGYIGGASIDLKEAVVFDKIDVVYEDNTTSTHQFTTENNTHYVLNAISNTKGGAVDSLVIYADGIVYDEIDLHHKNGQLYSFTDGKMTYRHVYMNEAGIFLGELYFEDLPEDISQNIVLEFCHKDETSSSGYHVLSKKVVTLHRIMKGLDLGFASYSNGANYDPQKEVFVIMSFSDSHVVEIPLTKGAN